MGRGSGGGSRGGKGGGGMPSDLKQDPYTNKVDSGKKFTGDAFRYGAEGEVSFYSKERDYAEAYAEEKGSSAKFIKEYPVSLKNPLVVDLPNNKFSDPAAEAPYINKAKSSGYDGVIFRTHGEPDEFYVVFKK
jgi:hypothetical protein